MGWSENLFNLVRIGELSYPEARVNRNKSRIFSSWCFSLQLQVAWGMGLPSNTNENELVRGKNILKCVQMGPARHESYSYQAQPDQEQCKIAIAIPPRGSCRKYGPFNVSGYRIQNLTVLFLCDPQWSFLFSQNLLASTKVAFKYFWRRRIVCRLCAAGSEVIYQLSLGSLRWRSQLRAWFGMDPAPDWPDQVRAGCNDLTTL